MVKFFANVMLSSTLMHVLRWNSAWSAETPCQYTELSAEQTIANCSRKNVENVPAGLRKDIWSLDISYNAISNISETSFEPYQGLVELRMREMRNTQSGKDVLDPKCFRKLTKLEYLDMTKSQHSQSSDFYWPTTLKVLIINSNSFMKLDVHELPNLEEIYANTNLLVLLPRFHPLAPLKIIDVEKNPIRTVLVVEIAPFCQLTTFLMSVESIQEVPHYCDCKRLKIWLEAFSITSRTLKCKVPDATNEQVDCEVGFYEAEASARRDCLARLPIRIFWIIGIILALLIILILTIVLCVLFVFTPKPPAETDESEHEGDLEHEHEVEPDADDVKV